MIGKGNNIMSGTDFAKTRKTPPANQEVLTHFMEGSLNPYNPKKPSNPSHPQLQALSPPPGFKL